MKQKSYIQLSLFDDAEYGIKHDRMLAHVDFHREPTNKEICMMCHFSSECEGCCKNCKEQCNGHQVCQIGVDGQADRLAAWMSIVEKNEGMSHLRKFLNVCQLGNRTNTIYS